VFLYLIWTGVMLWAFSQKAGQARMESFSAAFARRALGSLQSLRWTGESSGFSNMRMRYAGRTGVCGNGLCEVHLPLKAHKTGCVCTPSV